LAGKARIWQILAKFPQDFADIATTKVWAEVVFCAIILESRRRTGLRSVEGLPMFDFLLGMAFVVMVVGPAILATIWRAKSPDQHT